MHQTPSGERILHVAEIEPRLRHAVIFQLFANLDADASLQLVVDHAPEPLRRQFDHHFGDACRWTYLEEGPDRWRVRLQRIQHQENVGRRLGD
jgi:uncharacterized protein (DUF2249 family)